MKQQFGLLVLILHLAVSATGQNLHPLATGEAADGLRVTETAASATIKYNAVEVTLPLSEAAEPDTRIEAWLVAPNDMRSGKTTLSVTPGARTAVLTLGWPSDSKGKPVEDVSWYRISYRIQVNGSETMHGVLSVGAIAANLLRLRAAYPKQIVSGEVISLRVVAANPVTGRRLSDVKLRTTLANEDKKSQAKPEVRHATTGSNGEAIVTFAAMGEPGDTLDLTVEGTLNGEAGGSASDKLDVTLDVLERTRVQVETDKPLHKPGEMVHLRALVILDAGRVASNEPMTLTINDPDNKKVVEEELKTNSFGVVAYDWKTNAQTALGDYDVSFDADNLTGDGSTGNRTVRIQRYDLPEFSVVAKPDRPYYLAGEQPSVKIHAEYLFGKPVAAGKVRVVRSGNAHWNPKTGRMEEPDKVDAKGDLDSNGDANISLDARADSEDLKNATYENYLDLEYRALVSDASTGKTEPLKFTVRLTKEPVHIFLNRLGGDGREGEFMIRTSYADGAPAHCTVTFDWIDADQRPLRTASVATNRFGLAKVLLHYPPRVAENDRNLRITASDAQGKTGHFDDTLWMNPDEDQEAWISLAHSLLKPAQPIEGTIHGKTGETVDIEVLSENSVLAQLTIRLSTDETSFSVPATPAFRGFVTLDAFTMQEAIPRYRYGGWESGSARTVFYPEDRALQAKVTGLDVLYPPGAPVNAELDLASGHQASAGIFGVSVYDTAVEQRAESEADDNDRWYWGSSFSPGQFDELGDARKSLDSTDVTRDIADDLDLAAEAALENVHIASIEMEARDDSDARDAYEKTISTNAKPLGDAVMAADPEPLPDTFDKLKQFATTARLSEEILLDPWATPYRVQSRADWQNDIVSLVSGGPDKRFGTADDFTVDFVSRNIFQVPGNKLERILRKLQELGQPLPGSVDALKKVAHDAGLDLDQEATRGLRLNRGGTGGGRPLSYKITAWRQFYSVLVQYGDESTLWRTSIDYFAPTAKHLEAALTSWVNAGHVFPENEADARQVFKAAGVDFDALRDPLGRTFSLHAFQEFSYVRVDKVKASATIKGSTDKITVVGQVIQVLGSGEIGETGGRPDEVTRFTRIVSQQSGSDLKPLPSNSRMFKGDTGAIGGTVSDLTDAVVPGAKVTAQNLATNDTWETTTKDAGNYLLYDHTPGLYKLRVIAKGFESWTLTEIHVSSASLTTVDVELTVGSESQTVTVEADALTVQTDSNVVSTLISSEQISEIATENRNFAAIAALGLGVSSALPAGKKTVIKGASGSATVTEPVITPRLRHVFEETAYWAPSIETDGKGHAALKFTLPDSLTTWKLHAVGSTRDGRVTSIDRTFITFQPFFVDLDPPQVLTVGDEISLPVNLRNYTPHAITLPVTVKAADWFALSTPPVSRMTVAPGGSSSLIVGLNASAPTEAGPLQVTAANSHDGDTVEKKVRVHPDGEPKMVTASEIVRGGKSSLRFDLPPDAIPGSVHAELLLYPNLGTTVYHAMKAVLERPYGCGEQTISSTYPSLLFLELAGAAKIDSPAKSQAQDYLQLGYDRLMGYFNAAGGLTYWGRDSEDADAALTAYAIEFLTEAEPYVEVDRSRMNSAIEWLLAQQSADGSWKPHYGQPSARQALFIASALEMAIDSENANSAGKGDLATGAKRAIAKAQAYAASSVASLHDPYANSLRLTLAIKAGDKTAATRSREELVSEADHGRDGAHWDFDGHSPFYGWGAGGVLEATAMALSALDAAANPDNDKLEGDALMYLLVNRDGFGVWLSGQATVRVLKALLPVALKELNSPQPASIVLAVNGQPLSEAQAQAIKPNSQLLDAPRNLELTSMIHAGKNTLEFSGLSDAAIANAQITTWFYVPWAAGTLPPNATTVPGKNAGLDFGYACDADHAQAGQPISCTVSARRFGSQGFGMMLAEVGLPPGADVDRAALGKLLDTWVIDRYELQPDRIVFYLWPPSAQGAKFSFSFTPRYAIRAKAAPARLTDYYNPDLSAVLAPQTFVVSAATGK